MQVLISPVFKPFLGVFGKVGKTKEAVKNCLKMVRVTGLEPVRQRHTPLKRACLPIPAHSHILFLFFANSTRDIISQSSLVVNSFQKIFSFERQKNFSFERKHISALALAPKEVVLYYQYQTP